MSLPDQTVRFGPFQLDLRAAELHHDGTKVKLPQQPFQILAELVEHSGEVVTREELRQCLWRSDTFVDFEHGLNTAVKRLREALGDSAENPRYIETLPRHGYRLMVPVEKAAPAPPTIPEASNRRKIWLIVSALLVVAIASGVVFRQRLLSQFRLVKIESLAVLPLENLSGNPEEEYFADGMTEALITELGKIRALRVISHQSVMQYKGTNKPVPQIARELHVDAVVEGSALRAGGKVRITTQLIQADPERHLWSESYERNLSDVIALQREVAQTMAWEIQGRLASQQERAHLAEAPAVNPEAYEHYLRGRYYFDRWPDQLDKAVESFQRAIEKDPNYAPAFAGLALCYSSMGYVDSPREVFPKAKAAAMRALEIDESLPEAHAALGLAKLNYDWDWPGAERELKRAIELNPNNADARHHYASYLGAMSRFDEAIAEAKRAVSLDPLSLRMNLRLGWAYMIARRYDEAIDQYKKTLELDPNYIQARLYLAWSYTLKGMYPAAFAEYNAMGEYGSTNNFVGFLYAVSGRRGDARKLVEKMRRLSAQQHMDPYNRAIPYAGLGDRDNAIMLLNQAYDERSAEMPQLKVEPFFDSLRSDPRFQELVRRMNFPE